MTYSPPPPQPAPPPEPPPPRRPLRSRQRWGERPLLTARRVTTVVVGAVAVVFAAENTRGVKVRLLIPQVTVPLWTVFAGALVLGIVLGVLLWRGGPRPSR
jgi:uncharacterized integral membrane protein